MVKICRVYAEVFVQALYSIFRTKGGLDFPTTRITVMDVEDYNEDQYDVLRELTNIAMGEATANLDEKWNTFVKFTIPHVEMVSYTDVRGILLGLYRSFADVHVVKHDFQGILNGQVLVTFSSEAMPTIAKLINNETISFEQEKTLLLNTSNILARACLSGLANSLNIEVNLTNSFIYRLNQPFKEMLKELFASDKLPWKYNLLINVILEASEGSFQCFLVLFLSEPSIEELRSALDKLIEEEY